VASFGALIANQNEFFRAVSKGDYVDPVLALSLGYDPPEFDEIPLEDDEEEDEDHDDGRGD
jgi:hypothetical protein